jgi:tRNA A37 threonylcarbamoyladenosine dehydratase
LLTPIIIIVDIDQCSLDEVKKQIAASKDLGIKKVAAYYMRAGHLVPWQPQSDPDLKMDKVCEKALKGKAFDCRVRYMIYFPSLSWEAECANYLPS